MISPQEVEEVLVSYPNVEEAAVIGVPDLQWGERVRAIVVPRRAESLSQDELIDHCNHRLLASFKRPESVVFVKEIPKNHLGKVLKKRVLRERYSYAIEEPESKDTR